MSNGRDALAWAKDWLSNTTRNFVIYDKKKLWQMTKHNKLITFFWWKCNVLKYFIQVNFFVTKENITHCLTFSFGTACGQHLKCFVPSCLPACLVAP
jgi:hypothetical protein